MSVSYKDSGVDIDVGNALVESIKPLIKPTLNKNVLGGIGSFSGAYELPSGYKKPVLLSATDGVGTKLRLAIESNKLDTIGVDLVAMVVNDLLCNFATPMYFLDYFATSKIELDKATSIIKGIADGCLEANCALIGGESAEMPDMYKKNDFDLAGFAVGIAEKEQINRLPFIKEGNILIALPSSGIHSNGYSLVRQVLFKNLKKDFNDMIDGQKLIDILLKPTKIYVNVFEKIKTKINALAHITGGGIVENLPRVLPDNVCAVVYKDKLQTPFIFDYLGKHVNEEEMFRTFNMGVGMIVVADKNNVQDVLDASDGYIIGKLEKASTSNKKIKLI
ncbi:Phosphoribosylformylglycinamidine cyclo-ligase [hydrothermal vent metagenome]|uniref:Phosphoribosylformylglycinamidine cyclo-ligase n=1 Tax=hydrothermal vent metagenome TaxID=652676 RepID=A0A3B1E5I8_9ZZZZ